MSIEVETPDINLYDIDSVQSTSSESSNSTSAESNNSSSISSEKNLTDAIKINLDDRHCEHLDTDNNNYCLNCGLYALSVIPTFEKKESDTKIAVKKLSESTLKLGIPDDVINIANEILAELSAKTKRFKKKNLLDFYCLYKAYEILNIKKDTYTLGSSLGMQTKDINTAMSLYSSMNTNINISKGIFKNMTATELVDEYCNKIGFDDDQKNTVRAITKNTLAIETKLLDENPRKLISSVIKYYFITNGIIYDKNVFKEKLGFSDATLNVLCKKVSSINSEK
jgi:transcription initiation factor TFIIIB Brf1 subunit/transcription initiation factor TFIIB